MKKHAIATMAATLLLTGCLDPDGQASAAYNRCMQFQAGVALAELQSAFGQEDRTQNRWPASWYVFHPAAKDYELQYSGPIIAKTDSAGTVVSLQCSESNYAFHEA